MPTNLNDHLYPRGRSATEPNLMPHVKDSDGNTVPYYSTKRKTTSATVIDLGSAPNSNDGDPLRTAFGKVNNFIEAVYWVNEFVHKKLVDIDSELREGIYVYTDSDVRHNISLLDNSSLHLRGSANQIELSTSVVKSLANPHDFDSEVHIKLELSPNLIVTNIRADHGDMRKLTVDSEAVFNGKTTVDDNLIVMGNTWLDSDLIVRGDFTVNGTSTFVNSSNLAVADNLIVLNAGQATPFNDTGIIFQRYDSDAVSSANYNSIVAWDEVNDRFVIGETNESGIDPNVTYTKRYMTTGVAGVNFYDSDNTARVVWDRTQSRLKLIDTNGNEAFVFNMEDGTLTGTGIIDGGLF